MRHLRIQRGLAVLSLVLASACAATSTAVREPAPCGYFPLPPAWRGAGRILLFGEMHGTRELPQAFGEVVCQAARTAPVVVGLEHPGSEAGRLAAVVGAAGSPEATTAVLRASPYWTSKYQYGATSEAMMALLARLAALRSAGMPIEVFVFDVEQAAQGPDRDERMAANIARMARAHPGAQLLILTGNYHARTARGTPWDPSARFTAGFLRSAGFDVVGLDFAGEGEAWACMAPDHDAVAQVERQICGPTRVRSDRPPLAGGGFTVLEAPTSEGFAGLWGVRSLTPSPPALRADPARR